MLTDLDQLNNYPTAHANLIVRERNNHFETKDSVYDKRLSIHCNQPTAEDVFDSLEQTGDIPMGMSYSDYVFANYGFVLKLKDNTPLGENKVIQKQAVPRRTKNKS